jgi:ABC-type antimicrobial peptide transport system permease subunit
VVAAAGGLVFGIVLAFLAMRVISSQIYGVSTHDPVTFVVVPIILALTAGAASFLPALRISRIQPADTLRAE